MDILKASGKREPFNEQKFARSLERAGAPAALIDALIDELRRRPDLTTTHKLYSYAYKKLKQLDRPTAARYSLKYALYDLGPEGFLFERFVGEIFKALGYSILLDQIVPGFCVDHEVDVTLEKEDQRCIVECKFHNSPGLKTDVQVSLYSHARFLDIQKQSNKPGNKQLQCKGIWLVTNTQFTTEAIKYGLCSGTQLLGWAYPENQSLAHLIESLGLHPITSLTYLTRAEKKQLLSHNILLCKDLLQNPELLKRLNFPNLTLEKINDECTLLCQSLPQKP